MKNIKVLFKINPATYILILTFLFTGLIKNIILIYLIVIFHELGHIFIIKLLGYKIEKVEIYPMGGVTVVSKKINTSIIHELLIASFGIIFQIVLALIFFAIFKANFISNNTYQLFRNYNKTIMVFNMLPIIPLDGYVFLRSLIEIILPYKRAFYFSFAISIIACIFFITYNELYSLNNYLIISFLIYKICVSFKNFKFEYLKFQLERFLNDIKYHKIKYENKRNLDLLKKDTYHYFKDENRIYSEKTLLARKFKNM